MKQSMMVDNTNTSNTVEGEEMKAATKASGIVTDQVKIKPKIDNKTRNVTTKTENGGNQIHKDGDKTDSKKNFPQNDKYKKECDLCRKIFYSRGGFNKHRKAHVVTDNVNQMITIDENVLNIDLNLPYVSTVEGGAHYEYDGAQIGEG